MRKQFKEDEDYYLESGFTVMTAEYHIKRGYCCGAGCKHCAYDPIHVRGTLTLNDEFVKKNLEDSKD
jgi:hypothetical protein